MKYRKEQIVPIYTDYQRQLGYEGEGRLIEYIGPGLPFIIEDNPYHQITYSFEKWVVEIGKFRCLRRLRYKVRSGKNIETITFKKVEKDKFIDVDGVEIY